MPEENQTCTTSFYNGACPVCRVEMMRYKGHAEAEGAPVGWVDISRPENAQALEAYGITQDMAYRYIYVLDRDGVPKRGVDGLIALWREIPRWHWGAKLLAAPVIRPVAVFLYDHFLSRVVFEWNKYRLRRAARGQTPANQA